MVTERAIIFDKIKLRYARNVVLYGLPESPDTFTDVLCEITSEDNWDAIMKVRINLIKNQGKTFDEETTLKETQNLIREKKTASMTKSVVGLFSKFDKLQLERIAGTAAYKKMITSEAKDSFTITSLK